MERVYAILVNWNGKKDTLECIKSIEKLNLKNVDFHLVIVDNDSSDDSVMAFGKLGLKKLDLKVIQNSKNLGFTGGNNVGIRFAIDQRAEYILVLNNDTVVDSDLVKNFLKVFKKDEKVGVATGKIYFYKGYEFHKERYKKEELGKVIWSAGGDIDWKNVYGTNHGVDAIDEGQFEKEGETDFATGACSMFRVSALIESGIYDERYFAYLEDLELSQRIKKKGWKVFYVPKAILWHKVSQSSKIGGELNDYFTTRNRMLFGLTYAGARARLALVRESIRLLIKGREWQKRGIKDYYLGRFGRGSWPEK